jgi:hypothetical protein
VLKELKLAIQAGKLVALSGIVGCRKTTTLRHIQEQLGKDKDVLVAKSLSVEKSQISLGTLILALFYDLSTEKDFKIPTQPERRERALRDLIGVTTPKGKNCTLSDRRHAANSRRSTIESKSRSTLIWYPPREITAKPQLRISNAAPTI